MISDAVKVLVGLILAFTLGVSIYALVSIPAIAGAGTSPTPTPAVQTSTPLPTATRLPSPTAVRETATPLAAQPTVDPPGPEVCLKDGEVVWHLPGDVNADRENVVLGGVGNNCWIVGEIWTDEPILQQWAFAMPPNTRVVLTNIRGGTAWAVTADEESIERIVAAHAVAMESGNPEAVTETIILPRDIARFPAARIEPTVSP